MNQQPIMARVAKDEPGDHLLFNDAFYTIQGEGPYAGHPAVFIRLGGCNLQCPLCDTDYTNGNRPMAATDIASLAYKLHPFSKDPWHAENRNVRPLVVVTGGEPLRQNLGKLFKHLQQAGFLVQVETNGTLPPPDVDGVEYIVAPKTGKVNNLLQPRVTAYKYVLKAGEHDPEDGLPLRALDHASKRLARPHSKDVPVYVQPLDSTNYRANVEACVNVCMNYGYRLSLQLHKELQLP